MNQERSATMEPPVRIRRPHTSYEEFYTKKWVLISDRITSFRYYCVMTVPVSDLYFWQHYKCFKSYYAPCLINRYYQHDQSSDRQTDFKDKATSGTDFLHRIYWDEHVCIFLTKYFDVEYLWHSCVLFGQLVL